MKRTPKISSIPDRIRGSAAIVLTFSTFTFAKYAMDYHWLDDRGIAAFMLAGMLYMCTSLAYVFKDVDSFEEVSS